MIHRFGEAIDQYLNILDTWFSVEALETCSDGSGIVVFESALFHCGGMVSLFDYYFEHLFEDGSHVLEVIKQVFLCLPVAEGAFLFCFGERRV